MPDLFKHDVKTSSEGTAGEQGTGLGLPFCYEIMEAHGGTLAVESEPGKGSTFYAELPFARPVILIVNDEESERLQIKHYLRELDVEIRETRNGKSALEALEEAVPHLIVTEFSVTSANGFRILEDIRNSPQTKETPVIVVTSDSEMDTRNKAFQLGADDFLIRPIAQNDFIPRVRRFLG